MDCLSFVLAPARSLSWALEGKAQEDNPWERRQGRPALACRFTRSGSPFSLRPERFRARFIRFRTRFARPVMVDQGSAPGFCGMALETQSAGFLSFTEYAMQLSLA